MTWKRLTAVAAAAVVGASVLAGCGSSTPETTNGTGNASGGTFPTKVEHFFGTTEIKEAPKRVVSLGYTDDQTLLALGVVPVGMVDQYPNPEGKKPDINTQWPWVKDKWGSTTPEVIMKNGDTEPNYEKIAQLRPDLIVAVYSEADQAWYDKLSKIAPTVGRTKAEKEPFSAKWQDNALQVAKAVGKGDEGAKAIKAIDDKIAEAKKANPAWANETAVVTSWYKDAVAPFATTDVRGQVVTGIGFKGNTKIDELAAGKFYVQLSPERIDVMNVDRIFVIADEADQKSLKGFELFNNLPAVKAGKVHWILDSEGPAVGAAISQATLASMPYAVDELVKAAKSAG
ncbi:iron-siderophore ABC transporter substrate-binding protein [Lentzea sp. DG1S-22]|uniref:iron-siderophore ABC transporter substrate-binding protein n=1 Tax=unclassified Lentzea TaxID=2643253 RepID=UPI001F3C8004|nr:MULTISPECIES: iron-siderophore ABC transporter substrate-binding protein [unclassified Lentzea]MCG8926407.1 iron-siderophore ABC transporter substrate-binding protein [Lentzea sp. CC55]WVH81560.1 iron-siderophore ABC transporter substrate-binding protein [Lentzea sp. DG1S-22]